MGVCEVITHIQDTLMGFLMLDVPGDGVMG